MLALIIPQPFGLHARFIGVFTDNYTPDMIQQWLIRNLATLKYDDKPVDVIKYEHWAEDMTKQVSYSIVHPKGFVQIKLITLKLNEVCEKL